MKRLYFTSIFILVFSIGFSQSYPYLNASTCNPGEFPVDKDTNIYMFHGNRLAKTDKNFNPVWTHTYNTISSFQSLLLSKTGSIYFTAISTSTVKLIGKMDFSGNVIWTRSAKSFSAVISGTVFTLDLSVPRIFLDSYNNLVIGGTQSSGGSTVTNAYFMKLDTNGNVIKYNAFNVTWPQNFQIINDSLDQYRFLGSGVFLGGTTLCHFIFDNNTNSFVNSRWGAFNPMNTTATWSTIRSKNGNGFYVYGTTSSSIFCNGIMKYDQGGKIKWGAALASPTMPNAWIYATEEDEKGNLLSLFSCGPACGSYYSSGFMKIDSNGISNTFFTKILNNYYTGPSFPPVVPAATQRIIHNNDYYFDIYGVYFPTNPLTIQRFNSSLTFSCSSTFSASSGCFGISPFNQSDSSKVVPVTSYTMNSVTPSTFAPISFSLNPNYCLLMSNGIENNFNKVEVIFPNPTSGVIYFNFSDDKINEIEVYDMIGNKIISDIGVKKIDASYLSNGIYFIRIKTDRGEFSRKFIKE